MKNNTISNITIAIGLLILLCGITFEGMYFYIIGTIFVLGGIIKRIYS